MRRVVSARVVVAAAAIAACFGPHLSTTAQDAVVASQDPVPFGMVQVGMSSTARAVTLSPPGTASTVDHVKAITPMCSDFTVNAPGLPATVSRSCSGSGTGSGSGVGCAESLYTFTGTFTPTAQGDSSCAVVISLDSGSQTITFTGTGIAPAQLIDVTPTSVVFGGVPTGTTSSPATITVRNVGSAALSINSVALTANPGNVYTLAPITSTHLLAVGDSERYTVTCSPAASMSYDGGAVTITSGDAAHSPLRVDLKCTGIVTDLTVTPSPVTFPSARVGDPPVDVPVTVRFTGLTSRTITDFAIDQATSPDLTITKPALPVTLDSLNKTTLFTLHYNPSAAHAMGPVGGVTVKATGLSDQDVIVNAEALQTSMSVNPAVIDLGPVCATTMASKDVDVFANNAGSFTIDKIDVAPPFTLSGFTDGTVVKGGMHTTFTISLAPAAPGPASAMATLVTDIPGMANRDLMLAAQGLAQGVSPTPSVVQFGSWAVDDTSSLKRVQLTNCTAAAVAVIDGTIDGSAEFKIVNDPPLAGQVIAPMSSLEIDLLLAPHTPGPKLATLVLDTDAGQQTVELDGAATGTDAGTGRDRESYYACSTGGPAGLAPIALALFALRRRQMLRSRS